MLRNKNLVALSRQHHHALALCVRLDRALQAGLVDAEAWQSEIVQHFEQEVSVHFAAEEAELFPVAAKFEGLKALVDELIGDHELLRVLFAGAASRSLDSVSLAEFGDRLSKHIRKEERQLFEGMQRVMSEEELDALGLALDKALAAASDACLIPSEATKLRAR
ncbi:MAG TPA: hemerythrin domain-containing protein [Terriglobales bacterium]|jgi:hemerythrin-like domain-containing protein|nr:hemerythrin domain-containing protein [Terriglobales bacterium]